MMIDAVTTMAPNVTAGQVRALATTGKARSDVLPDVPTVAEAGVPGYEATIWLGLMAPAGTPKPIIDKLNAAVNAVVKRPEIVKLWAEQGAFPMSMTPEEFDKYPARRYCEMGRCRQANSPTSRNDDKSQPMPNLPDAKHSTSASMASRPTSTPIPIASLLSILRGQLGMTGPHFGCGANECGACNVIDRRSRGGFLRHAAVVGRGQGRHHHRRAGKRAGAASAAARLHRRAGLAMRLLRLRHPDERRRAAEAKSQSDRRGREDRARPQSLPLRFA